MIIKRETELKDFEFWSGAADRVKNLTEAEFSQIQDVLEDLYPEGMTETELNDIFWFDFDRVCGWFGEDEESVLMRDEEEEYESLEEEEEDDEITAKEREYADEE